MTYVISDACINCGTCLPGCPVSAISAGDTSSTCSWNDTDQSPSSDRNHRDLRGLRARAALAVGNGPRSARPRGRFMDVSSGISQGREKRVSSIMVVEGLGAVAIVRRTSVLP